MVPCGCRQQRRHRRTTCLGQAVAAPAWDEAPVWLHGDLHPANVVVSDGTLCGVIDFGELCAGGPATDLAAAWLVLPASTAARFFDAYADVDDATVRRARGWAVLKAVQLIGIGQRWEQGLPGGKQTWGPAGRAAFERVLKSVTPTAMRIFSHRG
jgi:Ser/Thr protein kinase RdoA (MazF antagonist)